VNRSLTLGLGMVLFGALLIYGGWTNRSIRRLVIGDPTPLSAGTGSE
jgi:hypothetical protein